MKLNTIYSLEEYEKQGFSKRQAPLARRHDILFNKKRMYGISEREQKELYEIIDRLGL